MRRKKWKRIRVAFQGERGAFSEEAAFKLLGRAVEPVACASFEETFAQTEKGKTHFSLVPIENSLAGSVYENYDLLRQRKLEIVGEVTLRIVHNLIAPRGTSFKALRKVYSHPVALAQCRKFFRRHRRLQPVAAYDTAGSVKRLMEERPAGSAAIASRAAARFYGAAILRAAIEDNKKNYTRFLLLAKRGRSRGRGDKTSIVFSLRHEPGALFHAVGVFAAEGINLTKIESRPIHGRPWEYVFYVDFLGGVRSARSRKALRRLARAAKSMKVLGSYPRARR